MPQTTATAAVTACRWRSPGRTRGRENLHRAWDNDLVKLALNARSRQQVPRDIGALARASQILLGEAARKLPTPG